MKHIALCVALLFAAPAAFAQSDAEPSSEGCKVGELDMTTADASTRTANASAAPSHAADSVSLTTSTPALAAQPRTAAERHVQDIIAQDGLHVVHFWAPWCPNAKNELGYGWADLIEANPNVSFTFVSIWNDGESGQQVLEQYDIPDRVTRLQQPDLGPSDDASQRRRSFLGVPMTWSPSTWIFHQNGELAFALNYGEMKMETIQRLIDATKRDW